MTARRVLVRVLIGLAAVLVLLVVAVAVIFVDQGVARGLIKLALGRLDATVEIDAVSGPLRGPLFLTGFRYRTPTLDATFDSVRVEWEPKRLLRGRVHIRDLHAVGGRIVLTADSAPPGRPAAPRTRLASPIPVEFDRLLIERLTVEAPDSVYLREGSLTASGLLADYQAELGGRLSVRQILDAPLHLVGRGDLDQIAVSRTTVDALDGTVAASGVIRWWPTVSWDLTGAATDIQPALLLEDPSTFPGVVSAGISTNGSLEPEGPVGRLMVDSLTGFLRGHPVSGEAEGIYRGPSFELVRTDVTWGSALIHARGLVDSVLDVEFDATVSDLAEFVRRARGSLAVRGEITGPRLTPRIVAVLDRGRVVYATVELRRVSGRIDVDLAPGGRNTIALDARGAAVAGRTLERVDLDVRGPQARHRIELVAVGPADSLRLGIDGRLNARTWSGLIDRLDVENVQVGGWTLERPTTVVASATRARVDSLCLAADSAGGRLCAEGAWRGGAVWDARATLDRVPFVRLWPVGLARFPGGITAFSGFVGVRAEAHSTAERMVATIRATSDTVAFSYREGADTLTRTLALDSAVVDVEAGRNGLDASMGVRLVDFQQREVATLEGTAAVAGYRPGRPFAGRPLEATVAGRLDNLALARPLLPRLDTLSGSVLFDATLGGTVDAPTIKGTARLDSMVAGRGRARTVAASIGLEADVSVATDRSLSGEIVLDQRTVSFHYSRFGTARRIDIDSTFARLRLGPDGAHGELALLAREVERNLVGVATATVDLPGYRRFGDPIASQPVAFEAEVAVPDLGVLEPALPSVDSLRGRLDLAVTAGGTVGHPTVKGTIRAAELVALLASGTLIEGGLAGDAAFTVARDSSFSGTVRMVPEGMTLRYIEGDSRSAIHVDSSALTARAGGDGIHADLAVRLADSAGVVLGTMTGEARLPGYTRYGQPFAPQPVEARLEGRADDLRFVEAFTSEVDTAAGSLHLDARVAGTVADSRLIGGLELRNAAFGIPRLGILVEQFDLTAKGDQAGSIEIDGKLTSGGGTVTIAGKTPVNPSGTEPGRFRVEGNRFEVFDNEEVHALVSPRLDIGLRADTITVAGEIELPLAAVALNELPEFAIRPSRDVFVADDGVAPPQPRPLIADIRIVLGDSVSFEGFNFAAEMGGAVTVREAPGLLARGTGTLTIKEGRYRAYGQNLHIQDGVVRFAGGPVDNPSLAIRATRTARDSTVAGFLIAGTLQEPTVTVFSDRDMTQSDMLSYIVTGRSTADASANALLNRAINSLGLKGGNILTGSLGRGIGLDEARLVTEGDVRDVAFWAGRYLSSHLYISYGIGLFEPISTLRLSYVLSNRFTLHAETGRETRADVTVTRNSKP